MTMFGHHDFPGASYDAWKTRSPDDDWTPPPPCSTCGSTWEDGGQEWEATDDYVEPFGWCRECGWRCMPCPDIEDAYERSEG
jgi:hypothetical protein